MANQAIGRRVRAQLLTISALIGMASMLLLATPQASRAQVVEPAAAGNSTLSGVSAGSVVELAPQSPPPPVPADVDLGVQLDELTPLTIDENWSPLRFDLKDVVLPTDNASLIRYVSEDYVPQEAELSVDEAVAVALQHNHDLNARRLSAVAACQGIEINWTAFQPQASLQAKTYLQRSNATATSVTIKGEEGEEDKTFSFGGSENSLIGSLAFSLTQRIYDWGLTNRLIDVSRAQYSIQNYAVDIAEQQLVANVITSYYQFSAALGQARIRRDELKLALEFQRQAQIQFDVGTVPRLDVIRAEARVEQARDSLITALGTLGDAAAYFYSLLGVEDQRYIPAVLTAELIEFGEDPRPMAEATQLAINTRPEVELQYATLLAGQTNIDLKKNRPILQAYGNTMLQNPPLQGFSISGEVGVQLLWNVYTGGKDKLERKQAQIELQSLAEGIFDLEAKIELDASTAWNRVFTSRASVQAAKKSLDLSAEALRAAAVGYAAGVTPYIDFQNALDTNVAAALGYLMSLVEVKLAQVNLERATGFPDGFPGDTRVKGNPERSVQDLVLGVAPSAAGAAAAPDAAVVESSGE